MGRVKQAAYLRPKGGGKEWETPLASIEPFPGPRQLVLSIRPDTRYATPRPTPRPAAK